MLIGYIFDFVSYLTQIKFSISSVRLKFCATTNLTQLNVINVLKHHLH